MKASIKQAHNKSSNAESPHAMHICVHPQGLTNWCVRWAYYIVICKRENHNSQEYIHFIFLAVMVVLSCKYSRKECIFRDYGSVSQSVENSVQDPLSQIQVEARIAEEAERARHYLDPSTETRITKVSEGIFDCSIVHVCIGILEITAASLYCCRLLKMS